MLNHRSHLPSLLVCLALVAMVAAGNPLAAQQVPVTTFISNVETTVSNLTANLKPDTKLIFGGQNMFAYGSSLPKRTAQMEIDYVDGLKAVGVQRVEFNPGVLSISDVSSVAVENMDATVRRVRQLGLMLAINPEYQANDTSITTFDELMTTAMQTYPALAARYQPDNFVIVHEPTTQTARMGITATPAQWVAFVEAIEPLIKAASPHTRVGAGDCSNCGEEAYFSAFVAIPTCTASNLTSGCLDFMTMDLYADNPSDFTEDQGWAQAAHASNKGVYMEETFAPHYLPAGSSAGEYQGSFTGAEGATLIGSCDIIFEQLDQDWLSGMSLFDSSMGLESMTNFTTQVFFYYASGPPDQSSSQVYLSEMGTAMEQGQLTGMAATYTSLIQQRGIQTATSISNASYATLPTVFNPTCGTVGNPCNANSTVAPDMIVSAFGADLANRTIPQSNFSTSLGGTTATLVDSTNTSFPVPIYSVAPTQVNYLVPSGAAPGPATISIASGDGNVTNGTVLVAPVAPGLYTYFADGQGTAAAIAICAGTCSGWPNKLSNGQFWQYTFVPGCTKEPCTAPISWGPNDTVVIELYGTGIRHVAQVSDVVATIGTTDVGVPFVGAQGETGLDQINVGIPQSLNGAGQVTLTLTVQDRVNNVADAACGSSTASQSLICINSVNLDLQ